MNSWSCHLTLVALEWQVILVGHSLGGGSIAYASELYPTKVSKAIYLSAVTPSYNQSMFSAFPADVSHSDFRASGYMFYNYIFYSDLLVGC
jgi:pimeloyl-ACP methyl ester carboxylesterase